LQLGQFPGHRVRHPRERAQHRVQRSHHPVSRGMTTMKTRTWTVSIVALFALAAAACSPDKLTEINSNPNAPTEAPPGPLFSSAVAFGVGRWDGQVAPPRIELLAQQIAEVQYPESDQYKRLRANFTAVPFNNAYNNELRDFESVAR